jgi:hypothetical protein
MKRSLVLLFCTLGLCLGSCSGPPAPDDALCRDVIHRLCGVPICDAVTTAIPFTGDCQTTLIARTQCGSPGFMFTAPLDRETFLTCRVPILRSGDNVEQLPDCLDVSESFADCPLLVQFLGGTP